uniref:Uncharacterized protein n=1 Tax=Oryza barthii TaxID=65489 RepID=A0A0D3GNY2_9ORYZ
MDSTKEATPIYADLATVRRWQPCGRGHPKRWPVTARPGGVVVVGRDAIGSVATDGRHDQEQPQHHPFSHRLPLQWQARPDGVASMAASSPPPSLWKMTTGGTAATRGGGGTADTSKCHRRATTAKNIHHAPLPPAGPSTLLPSNSLWWSQRHWDDLRSVGGGCIQDDGAWIYSCMCSSSAVELQPGLFLSVLPRRSVWWGFFSEASMPRSSSPAEGAERRTTIKQSTPAISVFSI